MPYIGKQPTPVPLSTSDLDDNVVTLAKMDGLARGKLIYGDASGDPAALAVGAADEVLTHDGTDFDWAAAAGGTAGIDDQSSSNDDQLTITDSEVCINEDSDDLDFRVESNGSANMFFVDAGNDKIGINTNDADTAVVRIVGLGSVSAHDPMLSLVGANTSQEGLHIKTTGTGNGYYPLKIMTGTDADGMLWVTNASKVGIKNSSPGYTLTVAGDIGYSGSITDYSLREIKENINEVIGSGYIDKFKKLKLYKYHLKPEEGKEKDEYYEKHNLNIGLIADDPEVEENFPEILGWVKKETDSNDPTTTKDTTEISIKGINPTSYTGILHAVIKELVTKVETLEAKVTALENA